MSCASVAMDCITRDMDFNYPDLTAGFQAILRKLLAFGSDQRSALPWLFDTRKKLRLECVHSLSTRSLVQCSTGELSADNGQLTAAIFHRRLQNRRLMRELHYPAVCSMRECVTFKALVQLARFG